MKVTIELDTKDPSTTASVYFDGEKQGYLSRLDLKLKTTGLNYMTVERNAVVTVAGKKQIKKTIEHIFRSEYKNS